MADSADSTLAPDRQLMLTAADLNTSVNHEVRIEDVRLAEALGMAQPRDIRKLIERHQSALERFGVISATVAESTDPRGRGRPGKTYWLNKRQALYLCTKSETANATEATITMVEVFDEHLKGTLTPRVAVKGHRRALPQADHPKRALASAIERDGMALMRIGEATVLVDMHRFKAGPDEPVVITQHYGTISIACVNYENKQSWDGARSGATP